MFWYGEVIHPETISLEFQRYKFLEKIIHHPFSSSSWCFFFSCFSFSALSPRSKLRRQFSRIPWWPLEDISVPRLSWMELQYFSAGDPCGLWVTLRLLKWIWSLCLLTYVCFSNLRSVIMQNGNADVRMFTITIVNGSDKDVCGVSFMAEVKLIHCVKNMLFRENYSMSNQ